MSYASFDQLLRKYVREIQTAWAYLQARQDKHDIDASTQRFNSSLERCRAFDASWDTLDAVAKASTFFGGVVAFTASEKYPLHHREFV